ncbi:alpha/beta hydrolase [Porphyrobacter sp. TH134]|uniref:alpha/beta fold hydrolase n=1 Tax=Porphyrobacter sp. TH134 TaxID=2067450 RepID=UPI000C79586F|nr:alpha/beta hydrolase [Porphyrobacter sp. TH134]PLK22472.1 alpha/beta hydrolase [Porphyrobacter sp. TH134]
MTSAPLPLLIPGNMCDARLWDGASGAVRVALEAATGRAPADADTTQDDTIAAMAARALAATEGQLIPIGFSMGAIVAVEMAVLAPDRIAGLGLIGYNATADLPERAAHRPIQQAEVRAGGLERVLVEELKPNYLAAANRENLPLLTLLRDMGMALGQEVFVRQSEALRLRKDRVEALSRLVCPVLLMAGEEDALCPHSWHRRWAGLIPQARLHILPTGHMLPLEAPHALADALAAWLPTLSHAQTEERPAP